MVLLQEDKYKSYYNELKYALAEYERVTGGIVPTTASLLKPHLQTLELKLRPGMITLTWTSMNIDAYQLHVHVGLQRLEELITKCKDIVENRIEKNLKIVTRTGLLYLPPDASFALEEFVAIQERHTRADGAAFSKNIEVENAVEDLVRFASTYTFDDVRAPRHPVRAGSRPEDEIEKVREHYNQLMYQALLNCSANCSMP